MAARAINRNMLLTTSSAKSRDRLWNNFTGMFLRWLFTKIAQTVPLCWTRWLPELTFKRLRLLKQCIDFEIIIQECSLGDCPPKLLKPFCYIEQDGPRAKNRKTFKRLLLLNQKMDFEIVKQECFLGEPNCSKNSATLNKMAAKAINRNKLLTTSSAKLVDRFWIISQECSLGDCLPKLLKPFRSVEQDGRQSWK